jgi:hypothetical protein
MDTGLARKLNHPQFLAWGNGSFDKVFGKSRQSEIAPKAVIAKNEIEKRHWWQDRRDVSL